MNLSEYQQLAHQTSLGTTIGRSTLPYAILGLVNEAGEVAGKVKKLYRDKDGVIDSDFEDNMVKELGDVLWYLSEVSTSLGISLDYVASENINKLQSRKERGTLQGSGDNR